MINALFVYGSLAPDEENEHFLKALVGRWQRAFVTGRVYSEGLRGTEGYPALDLSEVSHITEGLLFTSRQLPKLCRTLDAFEGSSYRRCIVIVRLEDGGQRRAYTYGYHNTLESRVINA